MSSFDYMDIDVSSHLSKFVQARRNYNEVIEELKIHSVINISINNYFHNELEGNTINTKQILSLASLFNHWNL